MAEYMKKFLFSNFSIIHFKSKTSLLALFDKVIILQIVDGSFPYVLQRILNFRFKKRVNQIKHKERKKELENDWCQGLSKIILLNFLPSTNS